MLTDLGTIIPRMHHSMHFLIALVAAVVVSSFTDWLFFGVLFHEKNFVYPEVWRKNADGSGGEGQKIAITTAISAVAAALFFHVCAHFELHGMHEVLAFAAAIWLVGVMPVVLANHTYVKMHPAVTFAHSLGWLARLLVYGLAYAHLVR